MQKPSQLKDRSEMFKVLHSTFVTFSTLVFHFLCNLTCPPQLVPYFIVLQIVISRLAFLLITQSNSTDKGR